MNSGDVQQIGAASRHPVQDHVVARRLVRDMNHFVKSYDPPLADLAVTDQAVVHVLWGWWVWMSEQAIVVVQAKTPRRIAAVCPLVRSVSEHADLMLWLHHSRNDGVEALHRQRQRWQRLLWDDYAKTHGGGPPGVDQQDFPAKPVEQLASRLDAELKNMEQRLTAFDAGTPYYIYRSTSDLVHANLGTSRVYAPVDLEGRGRCLIEPEQEAISTLVDGMLTDVALRCCQAAMIFSREVVDPTLEDRVHAWLGRAGIENELPAAQWTDEAFFDEA